MQKFVLAIGILFSTFIVTAQESTVDKMIAFDLVKTNLSALNLSEKDLSEVQISSSYIVQGSDIRMVYLQQTYKKIPVYNQMQVLAFKKNKLVSEAGERILSIDQFVNNITATPKILPEEATAAALLHQRIIPKKKIVQVKKIGSISFFGDLGVSSIEVNAQLIWLPINSKQVKLTWQIEIAPLKTSDHLLIRVDAETNKVLDKNNYTVYEQFNELKKIDADAPTNTIEQNHSLLNSNNSPSIVSDATYRVIPFPAESPSHTGGSNALVTSPWLLAPGNATSYQWHYNGTTYTNSTKGNNVWAQEDRDNNNTTFGVMSVSSTPEPSLTINNTPNYTLAPTDTNNQKFAITNLFYWNNITHDLLYQYGFNEAAGNFQANNQGRGGLGNDYVVADAQDAGGTNNANFSTPNDGSAPRMQMYIFNYTTPNRDGDLDNGVIAHEYGHGLSNRLTGGPANSSCLSNAEQGGEGWSDYIALMTTTNWATATVNDGSLAKPIGTYVLGQSPTGTGIRTYPYSTNMTINPWTYAMMTGSGGQVHKIGEIWCAVLWDMTWNLIAIDGINTNIFNASGTGGNSAALKLVVEGMRLQPCSPGYIDARNAILKADSLFFNGKYKCAIWKAFARRGMGAFASQGSSASTTDQVADFTDNDGVTFSLTQNVSQQYEGENVTYNHTVIVGSCSGISNYTLRDTLPTNVTYISGGSYDSVKRIVSYAINLSAGTTQTYSYTVKINSGTYYPTNNYIDESVPSTTISSTWTNTSSTTTTWTTSTAQKTSAPNSLFTANLTSVSDQKLETTNSITLPAKPLTLSFQGYINAESGWDGGVVEISTNNGVSWTDLGSAITTGKYNGNLGSSTNPLSGKAAFTGNSAGFVKTVINLSAYSGQTVKFRFRFGSDASVAATGWYLDDILLKDIAQVKIKSNLYNSNNAVTASTDTTTTILQALACIPGSISSQPANTSACVNGNTSISTTVTGSSLTYQWQISSDTGSTFSNISGATTSTLSINNVTLGMNGYLYRCIINGGCTSNLTSANASLTINNLPSAPAVTNASRCGTGTVIVSASPSNGEVIDWYSLSSGSNLLSTSNAYSTPSISATTSYFAASRNSVTGCVSATRSLATAFILSAPTAPVGSGNSVCGTGTTTISASPGNDQTINWYSAATAGTLLASASNTFTTPAISTTTTYYAASNNGSCESSTRTSIIASVNALPATVATVSNVTKCGSDTATISATALAGMTIDWYADSTTNIALQSGSATGINKFITPIVSTTTLYWASQRNLTTGCISAARKRVTVTINSKPSAPAVTSASRCGTGTVILTATLPTNPAGKVTWYSLSSGGTALSTSASYTTSSISATSSYYVEAKTTATGCISASRSLSIATINTLPAAPTANSASRCGSGTVSISATPGNGQTIDWYSAATNGTLLLSNSTGYTTPSLTASKSYYATAKSITTSCVSATRTTVTATITPILSAPSSLTGTTTICPIVGTLTSARYTTVAVTGATSYSWTIPSGAVIDSGSNGLKIKVRFITAGSNDSIYVQANNGCLGSKKVLKLTTTGCATTPVIGKIKYIASSEILNSIEISPNPTNNTFNIKSLGLNNESISARIIDIQGRTLTSFKTNSIDGNNFGGELKHGIYFIEFRQGKNIKTIKLIKL